MGRELAVQLTGEMLIGRANVRGAGKPFRAVDPSTGRELEPMFFGGTIADVERACTLASSAFDSFRESGLEERARLLEAIAEQLLALGDTLIKRASAETGLPPARLEGERGRTVGQLRLFASVVREGTWIEPRIDPALLTRAPIPRADLRQRHIAVGPVAVFGASNFPLAFSVAGGDTASALAAGLPRSCQSPSGSSRNVGARWSRGSRGRHGVRISGGCVLAPRRFRSRGRRSARRGPAHQSRWLHWLAARGRCAHAHRTGQAGADPRLCRDEQHQSGVLATRGASRPAALPSARALPILSRWVPGSSAPIQASSLPSTVRGSRPSWPPQGTRWWRARQPPC